MIYLQKQPYPFDIDGIECDCCDEEIVPQLVNQTDTTQFQVLVDVAGWSPQVVEDSTFQLTIGGGSPWVIVSPTWTVGGGTLCKALNGVASASQSFQLGVFVVGKYYKVRVVVDSLSGGTFDFTLGGNAFSVGAQGSYEFAFQASDDGLRVFGDDDVLGCVSQINAFQVFPENVKWLITDTTGFVLEVFDQINNPDAFEINGCSVTGFIDWELLGLDNACYYICATDPNENTCGQNLIFNSDFLIDGFAGDQITTGWVLNNNTPGTWQITGGNLEYNSIGPGNPGTAVSTTDICVNRYDVEVSISSIVDTGLSLRLGTVAGPSMTTVGLHTFQVISDGTTITLTALPNGIGGTNVDIEYINVSLARNRDYTPNACGPIIALGDHDCTHVVATCHNSDASGFNFDGAFSPSLRLSGAIGRATYSGDRLSARFSNGFKRNLYLNQDKVKELQISNISEYMHDFISTLFGNMNVLIDGVEHHIEDDEYVPQYGETQNCNAPSQIRIRKNPTPSEPQVLIRNCTGEAASCGGGFLVKSSNSENYITLMTGGRIVLNN